MHRQSKNPPLKVLADGHHLSNRRFRQLSPLEIKPKIEPSMKLNDTEDGFVNRAYSTDVLYNQILRTDLKPSTPLVTPIDHGDSMSPQQLDTINATPSITLPNLSSSQKPAGTALESLRQMWSVSCKLMKNTRFVCVVIANLFEGILIKGKSKILLDIINSVVKRNSI